MHLQHKIMYLFSKYTSKYINTYNSHIIVIMSCFAWLNIKYHRRFNHIQIQISMEFRFIDCAKNEPRSYIQHIEHTTLHSFNIQNIPYYSTYRTHTTLYSTYITHSIIFNIQNTQLNTTHIEHTLYSTYRTHSIIFNIQNTKYYIQHIEHILTFSHYYK